MTSIQQTMPQGTSRQQQYSVMKARDSVGLLESASGTFFKVELQYDEARRCCRNNLGRRRLEHGNGPRDDLNSTQNEYELYKYLRI
jgi:hypothetical protein